MEHGQNWRTWPVIDGQWKALHDPYAHALTVIQEPHRLAHDGMMFSTTGKLTGLANAGVQDILIQTNGTHMHLHKVSFAFGRGDIDIASYEGGNIAAGTPLVNQNTNRNSSNTSGASISYSPAITTTGTLIHQRWVPPTAAGTGPRPGAGLSDLANDEEWILAPNTSYLIRLTNNSGALINLGFDFLWYEVTYIDS